MVPEEQVPQLFLVVVIGIWGTLLLLIAEQAVRGTLAWWYRRGQHGNHHPTGPAARTVEEIRRRLRHEAGRPARSIVIRHRMRTSPPAAEMGTAEAHDRGAALTHAEISLKVSREICRRRKK